MLNNIGGINVVSKIVFDSSEKNEMTLGLADGVRYSIPKSNYPMEEGVSDDRLDIPSSVILIRGLV